MPRWQFTGRGLSHPSKVGLGLEVTRCIVPKFLLTGIHAHLGVHEAHLVDAGLGLLGTVIAGLFLVRLCEGEGVAELIFEARLFVGLSVGWGQGLGLWADMLLLPALYTAC